jgi:hypothetical protein
MFSTFLRGKRISFLFVNMVNWEYRSSYICIYTPICFVSESTESFSTEFDTDICIISFRTFIRFLKMAYRTQNLNINRNVDATMFHNF